MEIYRILTYQYSVTVNDRVEPVSNREDCALLKLVPDSLLDEAVSSKGAGNTTPENRKTLSSYRALGRDFLRSPEQWLISSKICAVADREYKGYQASRAGTF